MIVKHDLCWKVKVDEKILALRSAGPRADATLELHPKWNCETGVAHCDAEQAVASFFVQK